MVTMRVIQVSRPNGPFEILERPIPEPGAGTVRIHVQACGICHSDSLIKEGHYPGIPRAIKGWYSGTSIDSQDTLAFSARADVRPMNEIFPLERASEGYDRMMSGKARFRVVLSIGS
jgi:D-arabinose 1-dehydrogenase-like Zn-dependent alcohol dehydrogenase